MTGWLGIRVMCPIGATRLPADWKEIFHSLKWRNRKLLFVFFAVYYFPDRTDVAGNLFLTEWVSVVQQFFSYIMGLFLLERWKWKTNTSLSDYRAVRLSDCRPAGCQTNGLSDYRTVDQQAVRLPGCQIIATLPSVLSVLLRFTDSDYRHPVWVQATNQRSAYLIWSINIEHTLWAVYLTVLQWLDFQRWMKGYLPYVRLSDSRPAGCQTNGLSDYSYAPICIFCSS
jgi:hypothetical protein